MSPAECRPTGRPQGCRSARRRRDRRVTRQRHGIRQRQPIRGEGERRALGHRQRARAERAAVADRERAGRQSRAAAIGIGTAQHQRAVIALLEPGAARHDGGDRPRDGGPVRRAVADADQGRARQRDGVAGDDVAAGHELHADSRDRHVGIVHGHRARAALEDGEAAVPGLRHRAAGVDPVGLRPGRPGPAATEHRLGRRRVRPVPELRRVVGVVDVEVDLTGDRGLEATFEIARQTGDGHAVVGQRAAIVRDAVDAEAEARVRIDRQRAGQVDVAVDVEDARAARRAEADAHGRPRLHVEGTHREAAPDAAGDRAARQNVHRLGDRTATRQRRLVVDVDVAVREAAVHRDAAAPHRRVAGIGVCPRKRQRARAGLRQPTRAGQSAGIGRGRVVAAEAEARAGQLHRAGARQRTDRGVGPVDDELRPARDRDGALSAERMATAGDQRPGIHVRRAARRVVAGDDQRSGAGLGEIAEPVMAPVRVKVCASSTLNVPPPVPDTG